MLLGQIWKDVQELDAIVINKFIILAFEYSTHLQNKVSIGSDKFPDLAFESDFWPTSTGRNQLN